MAEPSPGGGGHVEIRVQRTSRPKLQRVVEELLLNLAIFDRNDAKLRDKLTGSAPRFRSTTAASLAALGQRFGGLPRRLLNFFVPALAATRPQSPRATRAR